MEGIMIGKSIFGFLTLVIIAAFALILGACSEDDDNPTSASEHQPITIVVLKNNTDTRIAGASIKIDNNNDLTCETSEPGGDTGGECGFMLKKIEHSITITKAGYHTLQKTFMVTGNTTYLYFSLTNN
jgi:hypothetical protein